MVRLVHPFPSILDGLVVAAVALLAGGGPVVAIRLAASMTALQFAIGALNDIVDARADAGRVPAKPIPGGLVTVAATRRAVVLFVAIGLWLAPPIGPWMLLLGLLGLAIGFAYDLFAKGTPWSWLPFAIGIPLLPVYGWFGASGALPSFFAALVPMAVLAGAALAIANARADLDTDAKVGARSVATMLGPDRSWWADAVLMTAAIVIGVAFIGRTGWGVPSYPLVGAGIAIMFAGLALGRRHDRRARTRAWEAQAVGAAIAAVGWIAAMAALA